MTIPLSLDPEQAVLTLRHLYPTLDLMMDAEVLVDTQGGVTLSWLTTGNPPGEAQLLAALPAAQAILALRQDLRDTQAMVEERLQMHSRAVAWGNDTAAKEITRELNEDLKPYMEDLKNAANSA